MAKEIPIANAAEAQWHGGRFKQRGAGLYKMWFGQVGTHEVYVWADSFDSAFEEAVEYLDDKGYCGFFTTIDKSDFQDAADDLGLDDVTFKRLMKEIHSGRIGEKASQLLERAEADLTMIGHTSLKNCEKALGGGPLYVPSDEWGGNDVTNSKEFKSVVLRSIEEAELDPADFGPEIEAEFE